MAYIDVEAVRSKILKHWYELEKESREWEPGPVFRFMVNFSVNMRTMRPVRVHLRAYKHRSNSGIEEGRYLISPLPKFLRAVLANKRFSVEDWKRVDLYGCLSVDRPRSWGEE